MTGDANLADPVAFCSTSHPVGGKIADHYQIS